MEQDFIKELNELCKKYNVSINGKTTSGSLNVRKNIKKVNCFLGRNNENNFFVICSEE